MRSADPAAYDQFKELTSGTTYNIPFRALYLTNTTAGANGVATFVISQLEAGVLVEKTIYISTGVGMPSYLLPISGEKVLATTSTAGAKMYALI